MNVKDLDGSLFLYDPTKDTHIEKLKNSHEDFQLDLGSLNNYRKKLLKFIILQYDLNTPLRIEYKDYFRRKANAALLAGFKRNKQSGKFKEDIANAMIGKNDEVNRMIVRYVMYFYNEDYLQLILYWEYLGTFGRGQLNGNINSQTIRALDNIRETISKLTQRIFGGDESVDLKQKLYKALDSEKNNLHPDNVTKDLKENPDMFAEEV